MAEYQEDVNDKVQQLECQRAGKMSESILLLLCQNLSKSCLSFPVQTFKGKADLHINLKKVKANLCSVHLFQTQILNSWFPIVQLYRLQ